MNAFMATDTRSNLVQKRIWLVSGSPENQIAILACFKTKNFDKLSLMAKKYWMILFTMTRLPWKISLVVRWHHVNHRVVAQNDQIATLKTMTEAAKQILDHILVWFTNLRTDKFEYVTWIQHFDFLKENFFFLIFFTKFFFFDKTFFCKIFFLTKFFF